LIFSPGVVVQLQKMRIDPQKYSDALKVEFGDKSIIFEMILCDFKSKKDLKVEYFNTFMSKMGYLDSNEKIYNKSYDLFNYLRSFFNGGVLELFKMRQAEWGDPKINITKNDVTHSDISFLPDQIKIYRGMQRAEYNKQSFGQSWTKDLVVAERFAFSTYSDKCQVPQDHKRSF